MQISTLETGRRGEWWWLVDREGWLLGALVDACPELFVNRFVAVTAFDSSTFQLSSSERDAGWTLNPGEVALSPMLDRERLLLLPGHAELSEWWVFDEARRIPQTEPFVTAGDFTLLRPEAIRESADPTWDQSLIAKRAEARERLQGRFWSLMKEHEPALFLGDGEHFVAAGRDPSHRALLLAALS